MILSFLQSRYNQTRWPFFQMVEVVNRFGPDTKDELNRLRIEGYIRKRESTSRFPLIQLLVDQDGCEIKQS